MHNHTNYVPVDEREEVLGDSCDVVIDNSLANAKASDIFETDDLAGSITADVSSILNKSGEDELIKVRKELLGAEEDIQTIKDELKVAEKKNVELEEEVEELKRKLYHANNDIADLESKLGKK